MKKYMKRTCHKCLFYEEINDGKCSINLCTVEADELTETNVMDWVSAYKYERDPDIRKEYDETCEYCVNTEELKNKIRQTFKESK